MGAAKSGDGFKRVWVAVLAFALVLVGVGGAAIGFGVPNWLAGTIAAVLGLAASVISDRVYDARASQGSALEARSRVPGPPRQAAPGKDRAVSG